MSEDDEPEEFGGRRVHFSDGHSPSPGRGSNEAAWPIVEADFEQASVRFQRGTQGKPETVPERSGRAQEHARTRRARKQRRRQFRLHRHHRSARSGVSPCVAGGRRCPRWTEVREGLRVVGPGPEPIFVASYVFLPEDAAKRSARDRSVVGWRDVLRPGREERLAKEGAQPREAA